ncbi:MAG: DUF551 domain-containing protein [Ruminococcus sp.]|nr:DUF551 domain-containing protein [Ruminococcus sp.]
MRLIDADGIIAEIEKNKLMAKEPAVKRCIEIIRNATTYIEPKMPARDSWIPVSERLPADHKTYICTVLRFEDNYIYSAELIYYPTDDTWAWQDDPVIKEFDYKTHRVVAWMPLPEPYKAE